jgi:hypothetical protein
MKEKDIVTSQVTSPSAMARLILGWSVGVASRMPLHAPGQDLRTAACREELGRAV